MGKILEYRRQVVRKKLKADDREARLNLSTTPKEEE
jgi:hypothetical protein